MTLSIWRYAHLALAWLSTAFLLILSVTGVILAYDAIDEKIPSHKIENFQQLTLAQTLPILRENYLEVIDLKVDHNHFITIDALDNNGNSIKGYVDPTTGKILGKIEPKSKFIQWITALHRSLFLKETGRTIVGIVSFLLMLISISGFILIIKRQKGFRHFFTKINKDFFAQYFHVVTGRWLLIPVLVIAVTGTLIFMTRLDYFKGEERKVLHQAISNLPEQELKDIAFFKETKLADVQRIEFPFIPDDEEEPFVVHLNDRTVKINQVNGAVEAESFYPYSQVLEKINIDLHTGRTSIVWAIILGLASINILFFIYSGFVIMLRRTRTKIKNKYNANNADIIILVGSENGTTLTFANHIHQQLLGQNQKSFLTSMNQFQTFHNAKHLLIFTSTYGLGDAPNNANTFDKLVKKFPQNSNIQYSVVGFGSKSYEDYCAYAIYVDKLLAQLAWAKPTIPLHTVNDRSVEEFVIWVQNWTEKSLLALATAPAVYQSKIPNLNTFTVIEKTNVSEDNSTFKVVLKARKKLSFASGDLLAIYPGKDHRERFYSIGKKNNTLQLMVKLFPNGFGSEFLYQLKINQTIDARIMSNSKFHFPKKSDRIIMIANGTGIAPFLGMIQENHLKKNISLYAGFRYDNSLTEQYRSFAQQEIEANHLRSYNFAFSREGEKQYVMDIIRRDADYFAELLKNGDTIMICGALKMQRDVEQLLDEIVQKHNGYSLQSYKNQILTDCY